MTRPGVQGGAVEAGWHPTGPASTRSPEEISGGVALLSQRLGSILSVPSGVAYLFSTPERSKSILLGRETGSASA